MPDDTCTHFPGTDGAICPIKQQTMQKNAPISHFMGVNTEINDDDVEPSYNAKAMSYLARTPTRTPQMSGTSSARKK